MNVTEKIVPFLKTLFTEVAAFLIAFLQYLGLFESKENNKTNGIGLPGDKVGVPYYDSDNNFIGYDIFDNHN